MAKSTFRDRVEDVTALVFSICATTISQSEQAFAINSISQSVRSSFHSARPRKRGLGSVLISLFLYPSVFDKLPMQCQNLGQAKAMRS